MAWLISCVLDMDMTLILDDFQSELWVLCLCRLSKWWSKEGRGCWLLILDIKAWTVALTYLPSVRKAARFTAASTSHHRRSSSVRWAVNSRPICLAEVKLYCVNWWHRDTAVAWVCAAADSCDRASAQLLPRPSCLVIALWATISSLTSPLSHRIINNRNRAGNEPSRSLKFHNHGEGPF